jgi:hypothetical protein
LARRLGREDRGMKLADLMVHEGEALTAALTIRATGGHRARGALRIGEPLHA